MYKKTLSLQGVALALSAFASQAESERQASRERIVEQVLKPCEGKKAGDKVVITSNVRGPCPQTSGWAFRCEGVLIVDS